MRVGIHRERERRVPEGLHHHACGDALGQQQTRRRVAAVVQAVIGNAGPLLQRPELAGHFAAAERLAPPEDRHDDPRPRRPHRRRSRHRPRHPSDHEAASAESRQRHGHRPVPAARWLEFATRFRTVESPGAALTHSAACRHYRTVSIVIGRPRRRRARFSTDDGEPRCLDKQRGVALYVTHRALMAAASPSTYANPLIQIGHATQEMSVKLSCRVSAPLLREGGIPRAEIIRSGAGRYGLACARISAGRRRDRGT